MKFFDFILGRTINTSPDYVSGIVTNNGVTTTVKVPATKTIKVSLTASQIQTSFSNPILAIQAPASGQVIFILNAFCKYNFLSTAFLSSTLFLYSGTSTVNSFEFDNMQNSTISTSQYGTILFGTSANQIIDGKGLYIKADMDSIGRGGGTVTFYITYQVVTL